MRASVLVLGPLLSRLKKVKISLPGGCAIGTRPIDLHLFGLKKLGASFYIDEGYIIGNLKDKFKGTTIKFPSVSVGATENVIMAASLAEGKTTIINAAKEPEIQDLINCLNKMGAKISITKNPIPEPNSNRLAADLIVPCAMKSSKPIKNTPPAISSLKTDPTLIASSPTSGNMSLVISSEKK